MPSQNFYSDSLRLVLIINVPTNHIDDKAKLLLRLSLRLAVTENMTIHIFFNTHIILCLHLPPFAQRRLPSFFQIHPTCKQRYQWGNVKYQQVHHNIYLYALNRKGLHYLYIIISISECLSSVPRANDPKSIAFSAPYFKK